LTGTCKLNQFCHDARNIQLFQKCVFTVRHTNEYTDRQTEDRQKTDMAQVLHICVGSLKDSAAVFVGLVMDQLEKHD